MNEPQIVFAGDSALFIRLEERLDEAINERVAAIADRMSAARVAGVRDVVPTFRSVAVYFEPADTDLQNLQATALKVCSATRDHESRVEAAAIRIPVEYGGDSGPDLRDVAAFAGIHPDEVIALHCARTYRVFMLGFLPGFAYLASVDDRIAMPRLDTPRTRVPAGSVGIAGLQTGIYPLESPGGWRLIGRTSIRPFDLQRTQPFLFRAGDRVQFYPSGRG